MVLKTKLADSQACQAIFHNIRYDGIPETLDCSLFINDGYRIPSKTRTVTCQRVKLEHILEVRLSIKLLVTYNRPRECSLILNQVAPANMRACKRHQGLDFHSNSVLTLKVACRRSLRRSQRTHKVKWLLL
jgi:hypothetical protein